MKQLLQIFFLLLPIALQAQSLPCPPSAGCRCLLEKADALLVGSDPDYERALYLYFAAQACDESLAAEAEERIVNLFEKIENLRNSAERLRITAENRARLIEEQQEQLVAEKEAAELATRQATAQNLNSLASKAIDQYNMEEALLLMQYANTYDPDNIQWLGNLQELREPYDIYNLGNDLWVPLPDTRLQVGTTIQLLRDNSGLLSISTDTLQVLDWEGVVRSTITPPLPISGQIPLYDEIVTWGSDAILRVWDFDGEEQLALPHSDSIVQVLRSPTGAVRVSITEHGDVFVWDLDWRQIGNIQLEGKPRAIKFQDEEDKILILTKDGKCKVFNWEGQMIQEYRAEAPIRTVEPMPNNQGVLFEADTLLVCRDWQDAEIFTLDLTNEIDRLETIPGENSFAFFGRYEDTLYVFDWEGVEIARYSDPETNITDFFVVPYTSRLVIWSDYQTVIWDWEKEEIVEMGQMDQMDQSAFGYFVSGFQVLPDYSGLLSWSQYMDHAKLWNWEGEEMGRLYTPDFVIEVLPLQYDGQGFVMHSRYGNITKFETEAEPPLLSDPKLDIQDVLLLPDGEGMAVWRKAAGWLGDSSFVVSEEENTVLFLHWKGDTITELKHDGAVLGVEYLSPPYDIYLTWAADSTLRIWDRNFEEIRQISLSAPVKAMEMVGREYDRYPAFWLENNNLVVDDEFSLDLPEEVENWTIIDGGRDVLFWPVRTGAYEMSSQEAESFSLYNHHPYQLRGMREVPPGANPTTRPYNRPLITWSYHDIRIWNDTPYEFSVKIELKYEGINGTQILPNGNGFVARTDMGEIFHYSWTGELIRTMEHEGKVLGLEILPDSLRYISWSEDCSIRIWDLDGNPLASMEHLSNNEYTSSLCSIDGFSFLPSGDGMISWAAGELGFIVWDLNGNEMVRMDPRFIRGVKFIPDKENTLLAWAGGEIKLWSLNPTEILKTSNNIGLPDFNHQEKMKFRIDEEIQIDREFQPFFWEEE